jgi:hypothetical protein
MRLTGLIRGASLGPQTTNLGVRSSNDISFGGQGTGFAELLCIKREAFEHEKEVRLLFQDLDPKRGKDEIVEFDLDVNHVFEDVVIDPRLTPNQVKAICAEIKAAGCSLPISQSTLYRPPNFNIPLS